MTGTIRTLVTDKGFGFIKGEDGVDYFFHRSALVGVKFDELTQGRAVQFEPGEGSKGPRAEDVSV
jgi:CspA family cold shock protein